MHDIDTALLRTFTVLAETGSFSRTANLVGRTQSTVTSQIAKLEAQLGLTLFTRTTRSVSITPEGEAIRKTALNILELCSVLDATKRSGELTGEIRFGAPEDFVSQWLPNVLATFCAEHPKVRLYVECDFTRLLLQRYEAGGLDLIITKQKAASDHDPARLLWTEQLAWVAAPDFEINPESILPVVLSPAPCVYRARAISALDRAGIRWHDAFTSPSLAGLMAAVKAGFGVAVVPSTAMPSYLVEHKELPTLAPADLVMIERPNAGAAVQALSQYLLKTLREESHGADISNDRLS